MPSAPLPRMMRPVQVQLTHAASTTDSRQVPAVGASIAVAFQGTTVVAPAVCHDYEDTAVSVSGRGAIRFGDQLQVGGDSTKMLTVDSVSADGNTLGLAAQDVVPLQLNVGDRLVVVYRPPALFKDAAGRLPISGNVVTTDARGYARFYCPEPNVDYLASGGGLSETLVFQDVEAGWESSTRPTLNVLDFATFQDAHDALPPEGGTIYVPAGSYHSASLRAAFRGLVVTKPTALVGEANGYGIALSQIRHDMPNAQDTTAIHISIKSGCAVRNLFLRGPGALVPIAGEGRGIRWYVPGENIRMAGLTIENVVVQGSSNYAFEFTCDGHEGNYVSKLEMIGCTAFDSASGGSMFLGGAGTNNTWFERCEFNGPSRGGFNNLPGCIVNATSLEVSVASFPVVPTPGSLVMGMGIAVGTAVVSVSTSPAPKITLSKLPVQDVPEGTTLSIVSPDIVEPGQLPLGHVHLMRTVISRFHHCSFQGPGEQPALSTDLVSSDLQLRDSYREKLGTGYEYSFVLNGMINLLLDGLLHQFHGQPSRLLRTGPLGLRMGKVANAQLLSDDFGESEQDIIQLLNPTTDELVIENSFEFSENDQRSLASLSSRSPGVPVRDTSVSGPQQDQLNLPNVTDQMFNVVNLASITAIEPRIAGRRVTLIAKTQFNLVDGGNLKLAGNFSGSQSRTITLVCDGTNWYEISRSLN